MRISDWSSDVCSSDLSVAEYEIAGIIDIETCFGVEPCQLVHWLAALADKEASVAQFDSAAMKRLQLSACACGRGRPVTDGGLCGTAHGGKNGRGSGRERGGQEV